MASEGGKKTPRKKTTGGFKYSRLPEGLGRDPQKTKWFF